MEDPEPGGSDAGGATPESRGQLTDRLQAVLDATSDVVLILGPDGRIERASENVAGTLGWEPSSLRGRQLGEFVGSDGDGSAESGVVSRLLSEGGVDGEVVSFEAGDGDRRRLSVSTSVVGDAGAPPYVCAIESPEGDRLRRDGPLGESRHLLVQELDLSKVREYASNLAADGDVTSYLAENPDELDRIGSEIEFRWVNDRALEFYGADSVDEIAANFDRLLTEDTLESMRQLIGCVADGETTFQTECTLNTLDGDERHALFELHVPDGCHDDYSRVYLTGLDVTERVERERELERRNESLDEFASIVSHDIVTPLSVVENKARLVELTGDPSHLSGVYDATETIQKLVDDLLELARQGKRVGETEPVEFEAVARRAWQSVGREGVSFSVDSSARIEAAPQRLQQLLENLLRNAVEHGSTDPRSGADDHAGERTRAGAVGGSYAGGHVPDASGETGPGPRRVERRKDGQREGFDETAGLSATEALDNAAEHGSTSPPSDDGTTPDGVRIRAGVHDDGFYVADDGPGIPEDERSDVFEQGYTLGDGGTGLGLAIVEQIVDAHDWSVRIGDCGAVEKPVPVEGDDGAPGACFVVEEVTFVE